jgi:putative peptidoglycan lipid II flippase
MIRQLASVGGWTLLSRVFGFFRDVMMAAVLGAGPVADAFVVAFKLPNHFRAIFGEGAFTTAFVPAYARAQALSPEAPRELMGSVTTWLLMVQGALLVGAFLFTAPVVSALAPGLVGDGYRLPLAVELTRITFPYLLLITLVTLYAGALNAVGRYGAAAAAPLFLNLCMIAMLWLAEAFATPGHAAAVGVTLSGLMQLALLMLAAQRAGVLVWPTRPRWSGVTSSFFTSLGPAVIGSAATQIAMLADTLLASFLPVGSMAALYYADRLYQLPVGVVAVAAGTVLLAEVSRAFAAQDRNKALSLQSQGVALITLLGAPCLVAFAVYPDVLLRGLFARGAFDEEAVQRSALALSAYAVGLPAVLLMRTVTTPFHAVGNTSTPLKVALVGLLCNVMAKVLLTPVYGVAGLALATSFGAWINYLGLVVLNYRQQTLSLDERLTRVLLLVAMGGSLAAASAWMALRVLPGWLWGTRLDELMLLGVLMATALPYGLSLLGGLVGRGPIEVPH